MLIKEVRVNFVWRGEIRHVMTSEGVGALLQGNKELIE
jgi:hypothetical protein